MGNPIDNNFRNLYEDPNYLVSSNPLAARQKPFDINAVEKAYKAKQDQKDKQQKKKDKNGKDIEDEEDNKPLPRPMGL